MAEFFVQIRQNTEIPASMWFLAHFTMDESYEIPSDSPNLQLRAFLDKSRERGHCNQQIKIKLIRTALIDDRQYIYPEPFHHVLFHFTVS